MHDDARVTKYKQQERESSSSGDSFVFVVWNRRRLEDPTNNYVAEESRRSILEERRRSILASPLCWILKGNKWKERREVAWQKNAMFSLRSKPYMHLVLSPIHGEIRNKNYWSVSLRFLLKLKKLFEVGYFYQIIRVKYLKDKPHICQPFS